MSRPWALTAIIALVLGTNADGQPSTVAITDVTVIDGSSDPPRRHMTVLIAGGRIVAVDTTPRAAIPRGAMIVDGRDRFLIPGLWDMHVHIAKGGTRSLELFIANGVTSVRDLGGDFAPVQRWRSQIDSGHRVGPRVTSSGPILESASRVQSMIRQGTVEPVARFRVPVADTADASRVVDSLQRLGVDLIKVRSAPSQETFQAIAAAARRAGLPLAAHGDIVPPEVLLQSGQRSVEHALLPPLQKRDSATRAAIIQQMKAAGVAVVPTMVNYYQWLAVPRDRARRLVDDTGARLDRRRRFISGYLLEDWREQVGERGAVTDLLLRRVIFPRMFAGVLRDWREMHRAGVRLLPGTDIGVALMYPGSSLHDELGYFVDKIGMTPMEALVSATRNAADFSGLGDSLGTVQPGKLADLVLLDADPTADIRNVARIRAVIARGKLYDRTSLDRLLAEAAR